MSLTTKALTLTHISKLNSKLILLTTLYLLIFAAILNMRRTTISL